MIVINPIHNGPTGFGHGGVAAGRFAELVDPYRARVRLHTSIPLGVALKARRAGVNGAVVVSRGDTVIAGNTTAVIVSRITARSGRKADVAAALVDPATGRHYAAATSVWFTVAGERAA